MSLPQEVMSGGVGVSREVIGAVSGAALAFGTALKGFKKVPQGEMGVRTRFGRVKFKHGSPAIVGAGLHLVPPFTHSIETISVQVRSNDIATIVHRPEQYDVKGSIDWRVSPEADNPYRAIYMPVSLTETITNKCTSGLFKVMSGIDEADFRNDEAIYEGLNAECEDALLEYGVELRAFRLRETAKTIGEMLRPTILEPEPDQAALAVGAQIYLVPPLNQT